MRPRIAAFAFVCALAWIAGALPAHASGTAECEGATRVGRLEIAGLSPCINDDTLWPHAGPAHFVAVGSTETVASGQLGFALVTSYLSRPIVLKVPSPGSGRELRGRDQRPGERVVPLVLRRDRPPRARRGVAADVRPGGDAARADHGRLRSARHGRPRHALRICLRAGPAPAGRPRPPRRACCCRDPTRGGSRHASR